MGPTYHSAQSSTAYGYTNVVEYPENRNMGPVYYSNSASMCSNAETMEGPRTEHIYMEPLNLEPPNMEPSNLEPSNMETPNMEQPNMEPPDIEPVYTESASPGITE